MAAPPPITYASTTRIGIGTTAPGASLTIAGNLAVGAAMSNIVPPADSVIIGGSVGIGTTVPQESLHINGNIKISNNLLNSNGRIILNQTGNLLQTQSIYTGAVNISSTASNTTILQLSITPSSTSSKIAIFASMKGVKAISTNTLNYGWLELFRNSTSLAIVCDDVGYTLANGKSEQGFTSYIDSPNTTNTITYYLKAQHITSGLTFYWRNGGITLMELAG